MGAILSSAVCCACTGLSFACSFMGCCCTVATTAAGGISSTTAKYFYLFLLAACTVLGFVLRFYADDWSLDLAGFYEVGCSNSTDAVDLNPDGETELYAYCKGDSAVYRLATAMAVFFLLHVAVSVCTTGWHRGFWAWKLILLGGAIAGFMFLPQEDFDEEAFLWTARAVSVVFLLVQLLLVIGFAYDWNDKWVANAGGAEGKVDNSERCWLGLILACSAGLYVASGAGIVVLYAEYECSTARWVTTITLVAVAAITVLTLFRSRFCDTEGAILPAAVVSCYITFLAWSALESNPDEDCKPISLQDDGAGGSISVGVLIAAVSLAWMANQSDASALSLLRGGEGVPVSAAKSASGDSGPDLVYEVGEGRSAQDMRDEQEGGGGRRRGSSAGATGDERVSVAVFHLIMIVTTLYMAMVLTNWGATETVTSDADAKGQMWARIATQWLVIALFLWTIVAPAVLSNRDFSTGESSSSTRASGAASRAPSSSSSSSTASSAAGGGPTSGNGNSVAQV